MIEPAASSFADYGVRSTTGFEEIGLLDIPICRLKYFLAKSNACLPGHLIYLNGLPMWLAKVLPIQVGGRCHDQGYRARS